METEKDNLGFNVKERSNDSIFGKSVESETVCQPTDSSQQAETDKPDYLVKKVNSYIYREDVVRSNKTGGIGVVTEVAGDSDSESDIIDDEDDVEDDDEDDEGEEGENDEENGTRGKWNANNSGIKKQNVGSYNCGALQADQVRVVWMDDTEPVQGIKDVAVVDRTFLHGDFVASTSDPTGQVGVVVDINISVDLQAPDGNIMKEISSRDLKRVRDFAVGDYVIHGPWLGRIDDVLDNVTVLFDDGSVCKVVHAEPSRLRPCLRNNLEEDAQFPYYPGQRVRASSSSVFKNSHWLFGLWKPKRLEGTVTKVTAGSVYVYWFASAGFGPDSSVTPVEQQTPKDLTLLSCFTHSNWQVGDWCLLPPLTQSSSTPFHKQMSKLRLHDSMKAEVDHQQESGYDSENMQEKSNENNASTDFVEESSPNVNEEVVKKRESSSSSMSKDPVHDSWPLHRKKIRKTVIRKDKKVRKKEENFERALLIVNSRTRVDVAWQDGRLECGREAKTLIPIENPGDHEFLTEQYVVETVPDDTDNCTEARRVGVVKSVNAKERTACVRWLKPVSRAEDPREFDKEEIVSVYELEGHPDYDYCYGDVVVRLSPVLVSKQASSTGNSSEVPAPQERAKQEVTGHSGSKKVRNTCDREANTNISDLSWVGNITGLKDGDIEVTWADGMVSTVGPQAIYVVGRDDDESVVAGSEVSDDAASWETVDDDNETDILENAQEGLPVETSTDMKYDAENESGRTSALALPLAAIEFVTRLASGIFSRGRKNEDSICSDSLGETEHQSQSLLNASEESLDVDDELGFKKFIGLDNGGVESSKVKANDCLSRETSVVSDRDAVEALCCADENSDDRVHHESDDCSFKRFDISQDPQDHHFLGTHGQINKGKKWLKKVQQDWGILQKNLPDGIYVRVNEDRMDLLRAVIVGAYGTPYQDGLFFFDFHLPPEYPDVPPSAYYHSGGWRINPNLYEEGKVCLSLLNTWTGRGNEVWDPKSSSILQVLVSLQGLVLNSKPYFNEAGYDKQIGTAEGEKNSLSYNENTFLLNCKTMMHLMRRPPKDFEELIKEHFRKRGYYILKACDTYMKGHLIGSLSDDASVSEEHETGSTSVGFKLMLAKIIPRLFTSLSEIGADCEEFNHVMHLR